jgi:hypothetical protein
MTAVNEKKKIGKIDNEFENKKPNTKASLHLRFLCPQLGDVRFSHEKRQGQSESW